MAIKKVVLSAIYLGQLCQNRMWVNTLDNADDERDVALLFRDFWMPEYRKLCLEDVRWFDISVSSSNNLNPLVHHEPVSIGGGQLTEAVKIPFACGVLQLHTGLAGRRNRGRIYTIGPRGGDFQNGFISPQGVILYQGVANALKEKFANPAIGAGFVQLVIHGEPESGESHDTPVIDIVAKSTMGVQRRRNVGVGQ